MNLQILLTTVLILCQTVVSIVAKTTKKPPPQGKTAADYLTFTIIVIIIVLVIALIAVGGLILYLVIYRRRNGPRADPFNLSAQQVGGQRYGSEGIVPGNEYAGYNQLTPGLEPDHISARAFRHEGPLEMKLPGTMSLENRLNRSSEMTTTDRLPGSSEYAKSHSAHVEFDPNQFVVKDIGPGIETVKDPQGKPLAPQPTGNKDNYPGKKDFGSI